MASGPAGARSSPAGAASGGMWSPAGLSWSLFEFARNPYYFLVVIYVFPPYFSSVVVGDPVRGQAAIAGSVEIAGYVCALTAPILGALMDRGGRRKPMLALILMVLAGCASALWFSTPGPGGLGVAWTVPILALGYICYTYSEVMHNAMLPLAGRRSALSGISGQGLALGQAAAAMGLLVVVAVSSMPGLLNLDPESHALPRGVGPVTAIWLAVFMVPFFLFMPDGAPEGGSWRRAFRTLLFGERGFNLPGRAMRFGRYVGDLFREQPRVMRYLLVRMVYADGVTTLLGLGGVYTAGVLGWGIAELALYGIWASLFGVLGGFFGGSVMDRMLGPRRAIIMELVILLGGVLLAVSVTPDAILYGLVPAGAEVHGLPVFRTLAELTYLGAIALVAISATAVISSSRAYLVMIVPRERVSEFFGLYMLAATATVWMGPLLVRLATQASGDQRIGFAPVPAMLGVGALLMMWLVRPGPEEAREQAV
jgi:MFS transporter, UMF1 family